MDSAIVSVPLGDDYVAFGSVEFNDLYGVYVYKRGLIRGSILAVWFYALLGLCLRFLARRLSKAGFWYDDWLLIPAIVSNDLRLRIWSTDSNVSSQQRCWAIRRVYGV